MPIRRFRARDNNYQVQEVGNMYAVKIYLSIEELSNIVKEKLSKEDKERFGNSAFVPIKIDVSDADFTITTTFVTTK